MEILTSVFDFLIFKLMTMFIFKYLVSVLSLPVSLPLWLLCGFLLERPGLCEQSLHGDAFCSGKLVKNALQETKCEVLLPSTSGVIDYMGIMCTSDYCKCDTQ